MKISVIAPTYNEAENVAALVSELEVALDGRDYEILIVDDDSPDLTWQKAEEIGKRNPRVRVLRRQSNFGLGPAVVDGFCHATGELVACIDADLQHDPAILKQMAEIVEQEGTDFAVGSRYVKGGSTGQWSLSRRFQSWVAAKMAQLALGIRLQDPMSGYFVMRRQDFLDVREHLSGSGFKIMIEILARLKPRHIAEVPYTFRDRSAGKSKLGVGVIFAYLEQLWRLSVIGRYLPLRFFKFGVVGITGIFVNLAAMTAILRLTGLDDWRASLFASLVATVSNYAWNNVWTFADRMRRGTRLLTGYFSYLLMSTLGLLISAAVYELLTMQLSHWMGIPRHQVADRALLLCQLVAISFGTVLNYLLNKSITWPHAHRPGHDAP